MKITFGKPVIYICNDDPRDSMKMEWEEPYYKVNCEYILIDNKLY